MDTHGLVRTGHRTRARTNNSNKRKSPLRSGRRRKRAQLNLVATDSDTWQGSLDPDDPDRS
eukprot:885788-Prymnesium_polylepis.1